MSAAATRRLLATCAMAFTVASTPTAAAPVDTDLALRTDLQWLASQRVFFGHQSVGANLLDGMGQLASQSGVALHIVQTQLASAVQPAQLGHSFVGENGDPAGKLKAFEQAMGQGNSGVQIAMVKFCYVDFSPDTDVQALFARYRSTLQSLRSRNPATTFVHMTVPLTQVQTGPKAFIKRALGRAPYGVLENRQREAYNQLLRQTYQGREPVFDLAHLESTAPDGSMATVDWQGQTIPVLADAYSDDGGHLNAPARLYAARALVSVLAQARPH